jgi:hypothetical protein
MAFTSTASTLTRRVAFAAAAVAVIGMGGLTACSSGSKDKPADTPSQSSPAPSTPASNAPQPTEKAVSPGGNSSFSPSVKARPAPTALPGNVVTGG